jgi:hypothetical protein
LGFWCPTPTGGDHVSYVQFSYASSAISVGLLDQLSVTDSQFSYDQAAFSVTSTYKNPLLANLPCAPPYQRVVAASDDWFGSSGVPAPSIGASTLAQLLLNTFPTTPEAIVSLYKGDLETLLKLLAEMSLNSDDTIPVSLYSCQPLLITNFPVPAVNISPRALVPHWATYAEKS